MLLPVRYVGKNLEIQNVPARIFRDIALIKNNEVKIWYYVISFGSGVTRKEDTT